MEQTPTIIWIEDEALHQGLLRDWLEDFPTLGFASIKAIMDYLVLQDTLSEEAQQKVIAFVVDNTLPEASAEITVGNDVIEQIKARPRYNESMIIANSATASMPKADRHLHKRDYKYLENWIREWEK